MKDFSLILPTRDHPALAMRALESIADTACCLTRLEIILYVDEDDMRSREISHPLLSISKLVGQSNGAGVLTRKCYEASAGKYVMLINDDMIFRTKNWDAKVLEVFSRFHDGIALVYGNDLYYGARMSTFPILSRAACELMENICPREYRRHCIDPHILDIFKRLEQLGYKRTIYLSNVIFEHMHNELGILINDPGSVPQSDEDDQELYFKLADYRQYVARKMAEYIEKNRIQKVC